METTETPDKPTDEESPGPVIVPKNTWGGRRANSGGARPNSGPKKPPAYEPPTPPEAEEDQPLDPEAEKEKPSAEGEPLIVLSRDPFPSPPRFDCKPKEFFAYWASLSPGIRARAMVYIYRIHPKMDYTRGLSPEDIFDIQQKKRRGPRSAIDKPTIPFDPEDWKREMLRRYGSGSYNIRLNDVGIKGDKKLPPRNICMVTDTGDLLDINCPPVLPLDKLDLTATTNQAYIRELTLKGVKIPGYQDPAQQENEMAAASVTAAALEQMGRANDRAFDMLERSKEENKDKPAALDVTGAANLKAVEVVAEAGKTAVDMLKQQMNRESAAADPEKQYQHLERLATILRGPTPTANGGSDKGMLDIVLAFATKSETQTQLMIEQMRASNAALIAQIQDSNKTIVELLSKRLEVAEKALQEKINPATQAQQAAGSQMSIVQEVFKIVDLVQKRVNGAAASADAGPWYVPLLERLPDALQGITHNIASTWHNAAVVKTGTGQPVAPTAPALESAGEPQQAGTSGTQTGGEMNEYKQFLQAIEKPLIESIDKGITGSVFGAQICLNYGTATYERLREAGKDKINSLIQLVDQPLWAQILQRATAYDAFMTDFLNPEAVNAAFETIQREQARRQAQAPQSPATNPQAPRVRTSGAAPQAVVDATKQ